MNEKYNNIIEKVNAQISSGKVKMRSRAIFVCKSIALVLLSIFVFLTTTLMVNFIIFSIHIQSTDAFLGFGPRGWYAFLTFFPWILLVVDAVGTILLIMLLRTFRFGYRVPLLYIAGAVFVAASVFGFAVERHTPMNDVLLREANRSGMPRPIPMFFNRLHTPPPGEGRCHCEVTAIIDATHLEVRDVVTDESFTAVMQDDVHGTTSGLTVGDVVFMGGEMKNGVFEVFGIRTGERRGSGLHRKGLNKL
ncbi:hypothetical protein IPH92_02895 [Candidatus Kaiserbacteria bacterium]|nr:MAG: hypothetical protein IPH92_02895 [Candidatus Kaiserbacteria bacterium]